MSRRSLVDVGTSRPGSTLAVRVAVPTEVARLLQWPLRYGRQFSHNFPDFLHEQFIQRPLLLQRQHTEFLGLAASKRVVAIL